MKRSLAPCFFRHEYGRLVAMIARRVGVRHLQTVEDANQATGLRVSLPLPDCAARPSDCEDVAVLNTLDGFSLQPRLSIPFSGAVELATVSSDTVFLVAGPPPETLNFIP